MKFEFELNLNDYRKSAYMGLALSLRKTFRIFTTIAGASAAILVCGLLGFCPLYSLPGSLLLLYCIWLAIVFVRAEFTIRKTVQSETSLINQPTIMTFTDEEMTMDVPSRDFHINMPLAEIWAVYETDQLFDFYIHPSRTILLPHSAMTSEERDALRSLFGRKLKERFVTSFGQKSATKRKRFF
ncbi:MAG: YcxB family protein [Oscillospiraceae bacterium]